MGVRMMSLLNSREGLWCSDCNRMSNMSYFLRNREDKTDEAKYCRKHVWRLGQGRVTCRGKLRPAIKTLLVEDE